MNQAHCNRYRASRIDGMMMRTRLPGGAEVTRESRKGASETSLDGVVRTSVSINEKRIRSRLADDSRDGHDAVYTSAHYVHISSRNRKSNRISPFSNPRRGRPRYHALPAHCRYS